MFLVSVVFPLRSVVQGAARMYSIGPPKVEAKLLFAEGGQLNAFMEL